MRRITGVGTGRSRLAFQRRHVLSGVNSHQPIHSTGRGRARCWVIASRQGRSAWVASTITGMPAATAPISRSCSRCWIDGQGPCTAGSPNTSARIASVESTTAGCPSGPAIKGARARAVVVLPLAGGPISR